MCGIAGGFGDRVEEGVKALVHRGPDAQGLIRVGSITLGHTRLAILDLDPRSNQPFQYGDVTLVFNGEVWNHQEVRRELEQLGYSFQTTGDTEVVAAALSCWGTEALPKLNGMFAMGWTTDGETLHLARDRFGEVPLHVAKQKPFCFASEKKALLAMGADRRAVADVEPGHWAEVTKEGMRQVAYYDIPTEPVQLSREQASQQVYRLLGNGVRERTIADVPVCTLLSGGIDSAAVACFLAQELPGIVAYTAVHAPGSSDLRCARLVADHLGIELREVRVPAPSPDDLAGVVWHIEMPHKAQVEIGWPCLKLAEAMHADGFKVTFSGEGSDELWASYGFAYHGLRKQDWHQYRKDLFLSQARKNFARCNKVFMARSVECRLPFLHPPLVEHAISLPMLAVQDGKGKPKAVLQQVFVGKLPDPVTRRAKLAFQDGMGIKQAISQVLSQPERFYRAEHSRCYA